MKRTNLLSPRDQRHLLLACLLGSGGGALVLLVGLELLRLQGIHTMPERSLLLLLSVVIGAGAGLILFLQRELWRPLKELLKALPRRVKNNTRLEINDGVAPLQLLAHRINDLLAQLNQNVTEQREQVRTLAHDIRGPLTRLLLRVEALGQQPHHDPELVAGLEADLEALMTLDQELAEISEPMHRPIRFERVALKPLCQVIANRYNAGLVVLDLEPMLTAVVDERLLERTLHNLIDNALEHGGPPVTISAKSTAELLTILVDDAGTTEIQSAGLAVVPPGHQGLGLAIARRFCDSHGGELLLKPSSLGGLQVQLTLKPGSRSAGRR
jgi:two-component system osmolarity sensor histidine kinase EnvZ